MNERAEDSSPASAPCHRGCGRHAPLWLPHQRVQGLVLRAPDWWSQPHKLPAPVSPHPTTVLLVTRSAAYSHPAGHGWRPGHCDGSCPCGFPIALSLSPSSSFPSRTLCWFVHTRIHTAWSSRQSAAGIAMPAPIVTVTQPHGHFVPLRPCWKLEQGISEINST